MIVAVAMWCMYNVLNEGSFPVMEKDNRDPTHGISRNKADKTLKAETESASPLSIKPLIITKKITGTERVSLHHTALATNFSDFRKRCSVICNKVKTRNNCALQ